MVSIYFPIDDYKLGIFIFTIWNITSFYTNPGKLMGGWILEINFVLYRISLLIFICHIDIFLSEGSLNKKKKRGSWVLLTPCHGKVFCSLFIGLEGIVHIASLEGLVDFMYVIKEILGIPVPIWIPFVCKVVSPIDRFPSKRPQGLRQFFGCNPFWIQAHFHISYIRRHFFSSYLLQTNPSLQFHIFQNSSN